MAQITLGQSNFNQGEIGPFMAGRADNEVYRRALSIVENWIVVPQGGLLRRPGFEFVHDLQQPNGLEARLTRFSFNKQQEYVQLWRDMEVLLFRQKALASTVPTPFTGEETRVLRVAQSGDTQIVAHFNHPPRLLERLGSDTAWGISELVIDPLPYFQFNRTHELSVAPTALGPAVATLSGSEEGYWNAGHFGNDIQVRIEPTLNTTGDPDPSIFVITTPVQDAVGGSPVSIAGPVAAANAFDGSDATECAAGTDGWIGYGVQPNKVYRVVGFRRLTSVLQTLVLETDDNPFFTSPTEIATAIFTAPAGEWVYINVPRHAGDEYFRIRETGGADLTVAQLVFNEGLAANGDITGRAPDAATFPTRVWPEQAWGTHHGYPRTVEFIGNRLAFGGTRDEPATIFFGKDGDLFNFDDNRVNADSAFTRTLSTDENHFIRDMKAERDGLVIFTSDGVFNLDGDGAPITPTNVSIEPQVRIGVSQVAVAEVDGNLIYVESNGKQISSIAYSFGADQYVTDSKTTLAHHLFTDTSRPRAMTGLRAYRDTQANLLFVPREDGEMAVLTQDQSKQVLGWSRFKTSNPDGSAGKFRDAVVVETDHGDLDINGVPITVPTCYALIERTVDGAAQTFLEALTEEDVYLDHWYVGQVTNQEAFRVEILDPGIGYTVGDILTVENNFESRHLTFPDDTGYLIVGDFDMPMDEFSLEFDIRATDDTRAGTLFSYVQGSTVVQVDAVVVSDLRNLTVTIGGTTVVTGLRFNDGERHRLTITWTGAPDNVLRIHDNGALRGSFELIPTFPLLTDGTLVVGQDQDSMGGGFDPAEAFVGDLHQFKVWSPALTFDEIAQGRANDPLAKDRRNFQFNEAKGPIVTDEVFGATMAVNGNIEFSFVPLAPPEKATLKVTAVDLNGGITGIKVRTGGDYDVVPDIPHITTGGTGSLSLFNVYFRPKPKSDWSGIDTLPNSEIMVVGDGFVVGKAQVDAAGNFTIGAPVEHINAGIGYPSFGETMKLALISGGQVVRGKNMVLKEAVMDFDKTLAFEVNGYPVYFRTWDNFVFETGLVPFTGQKRVKISNRGSAFQRDPKVNFSVTQPVAAHLLSLTLEVNIGV